MGNSDFGKTTTTDLTGSVPDYRVSSKTTDGGYSSDENRWSNPDASKNYGYYFGVGEYRSAINSYVIRCLGWGYDCLSSRDQINLNLIKGNGKETFWSIIFNHLQTKKWNGDSYTQIIRENESDKFSPIVNMKRLDPRRMTNVTNKQGRLIYFEYEQGAGVKKRLELHQVLYSMNNPSSDEPHGTSETSAVEWVIEAIQEAYRDWRRLMHVSSVRIFFVDEQDITRQNVIKTQYATAIKSGEVMMLTCKPEDAKFQDLTVPAADAWVRYLDNLEGKFYSQLGISKVSIGGTTENNTEASAKVNMVITEPVWIKEITELENDIKNQLGIEIKIRKQPSLMDNMQSDEAANTGQSKLEMQGAQ